MRRNFLIATLLSLVMLSTTSASAESDTQYPSLTLWPLASHSESAKTSTTDILWPFLHYQRRDTLKRWQFRPGLLGYTTDSSRDYRQFYAMWLLTSFEREGTYFDNYIFPCFWHGSSKYNNNWFHLWPLYGQWSNANGDKGKTVLWPFFIYLNNPKTSDWSVDYFMPLGRKWQEGDESGGRLLPLFWWKKTPEKRAGFVFPYYWNIGTDTNRYGLFPFWYSKTAPNESFDQLALYFSYRSPRKNFSSLVPFWFSYASDENRFQLLLPLWLKHQNDEIVTNAWFPFYFHHSDFNRDSELNYYFPFYGHYRRSDYIDDRYYLFPLYAHRVDKENDYESWNVLSPLFHYDQSGNDYQAWALPFFWNKRTDDRHLSMAMALYWASEKEDSGFKMFAPIYWHSHNKNGSQRHIIPFYNDFQRDNGWRKRFFLGPLTILTEDKSAGLSKTDILWPLISRQRRPDSELSYAFPFYFHKKDNSGHLTLASAALLPPYYINYDEGDESIHHFWPFYGVHSEDEYREFSSLWPFLRWGKSEDDSRGSWQFLLAFGNRDDDESSYGLVPLWWHDNTINEVKDISLLHYYRSQGYHWRDFAFIHLGHPELSLLHFERDGRKRHQHLFPLYSYRHDKSEDQTNFSVIWPLFDYQRQGEKQSSWRFLWRLLHLEKSDERNIFEFSPFYYRDRSLSGEVYRSYLGGFYTSLTKNQETQRRFLWFIRW